MKDRYEYYIAEPNRRLPSDKFYCTAPQPWRPAEVFLVFSNLVDGRDSAYIETPGIEPDAQAVAITDAVTMWEAKGAQVRYSTWYAAGVRQ